MTAKKEIKIAELERELAHAQQDIATIIRDVKCDISRSWHARENYSRPLVREAMYKIEEAIGVWQSLYSDARNDVAAARRERDDIRKEAQEVAAQVAIGIQIVAVMTVAAIVQEVLTEDTITH